MFLVLHTIKFDTKCKVGRVATAESGLVQLLYKDDKTTTSPPNLGVLWHVHHPLFKYAI